MQKFSCTYFREYLSLHWLALLLGISGAVLTALPKSTIASEPPATLQEATEAPTHVREAANGIQGELLRIFALPPHTCREFRIQVLADQQLNRFSESSIRSLYSNHTIYLAKSLIDSSGPSKINLMRALRHELVHWIVACISADRAPAWLDEGLAQYFTGSNSPLVNSSLRSRRAALRQIPLSSLQESFHHRDEDSVLLAYARAQQATRALILRWTLPRVKDYLQSLAQGLDSSQSFRQHFGLTLKAFEQSLDDSG